MSYMCMYMFAIHIYIHTYIYICVCGGDLWGIFRPFRENSHMCNLHFDLYSGTCVTAPWTCISPCRCTMCSAMFKHRFMDMATFKAAPWSSEPWALYKVWQPSSLGESTTKFTEGTEPTNHYPHKILSLRYLKQAVCDSWGSTILLHHIHCYCQIWQRYRCQFE